MKDLQFHCKVFILALLLMQLPIQLASAEGLSLQDAIARAESHSPDVRSLEEQVKAAKATKRLTLAPSDPGLSLNYNDEPSLTKPGSSASKSYQVSQPIAFPGKAFVNYDAAEAQEKSLKEQLRSMQLQIAYNVKQAYWQLALARKNLILHKALKDDYDEILAVAKRRYETGSITQVDYLNASVNIYADDNTVGDLQAAEQNARSQLNILLGLPPQNPVQVGELHFTKFPEINDADAEAKMLANRAEIAAAQDLLAASDSNYKLAKMSLLPDFQLIGGTTDYLVPGATPFSGTTNRNHTYMIGLQMNIPLYAPISQKETINNAEHNKHSAEANLQSIKEQSHTLLVTTTANLRILAKKLENYEKHLLPLARQSFKLALTNYGLGKIDFQTLSDTAATMRGIESDYNTAIANYLMAYSTYGQLIGEDL